MSTKRCFITSSEKKPLQLLPPYYRWVVLFTLFFSFVVFAFVFQLVPPILNTLQKEFGVNDAEAGLLMSMVMIPGILIALPAGFVINKRGFRSLGLLSIISVAIGSLVTALAENFATALLGRIITGIGGGFLIVGIPTVIPQWFSHKELGKAMGTYGTNMPVAIITAFPTATLLTQNFGWRSSFYFGAVLSIACALLFLFTVKQGPLRIETKPVNMEITRAMKAPEVWKIGLVWMLFNTVTIGYLTWAPKLFEQFKGLDTFYASLLASLVMYSAVCFVPVFGWASDRSGRRKPFIVTGSLLMSLTLISIAYTYNISLLISVLGLGVAAAMVPPLVMTATARSLPPELSGTGFSIVTLCQNVGITLSAPLVGYLMQTTQSISTTFLWISLFTFAGTAIALTIRTK